ncbi:MULTISPECIES: hypothetical protein [Halomonas]|uniref:hypothetical protein n=1 Tax=Halomonas TaxID=2745 RepID=UPI003CEB3F63
MAARQCEPYRKFFLRAGDNPVFLASLLKIVACKGECAFNDRLLPVLGRQAPLLSAFGEVNNVLYTAVAGITKMVTTPGLINVDFADVKAILSMQGIALKNV